MVNMCSLELFPTPIASDGRTLREVNERLEDGVNECVVIDEAHIYPTIEVRNEDIMKPSITNESVDNIFITKDMTLWKRFLRCLKTRGFVSALEMISEYDNYYHLENSWFLRFSQKLCQTLLYLWQLLLNFYIFIYPYALKSNEELCHEFNKSMDWRNGLIRAFQWHPNGHKCAVCHINDCIYIYSFDNSFVPLLKHSLQTKVTALSWSPTREDILAVCCDSVIILWTLDPNSRQYRPTSDCINIIHSPISPLTDMKFDPSGQYLAACSPQSSKLCLIEVEKKEIVKTIRRFGTCFTRVFWSPDKTRLLSATTAKHIRVYETKGWSSAKWNQQFSGICQTACWSRPIGHLLLVALRDCPSVFAIPFYDSPQPNDVGGTRHCLEVLDISEHEFPNGIKVGGSIHDMIWDKNSERLVISFKDNREWIALYKTVIRPNLEMTPIGFVHGLPQEIPLHISFNDSFRSGSLLTVCWNSGVVSYIPLQFDSKTNKSMYTSGTPRSLTSFCVASPNRSITSNNTSLRGTPLRPSKVLSSPLIHFTPNDSVLSPKRPLLFTTFTKRDSSYDSLE
ncbi:unnamed protein product [Oppiella nova]|uniref:Aladin seven-bladed propeller domain-containing protein n=1 Tax=Oppiella nova TaxID=334625 RepID=A0A7R9LDX6_9ACAR|nr:unnamed protein product [Oppiella nova]CAG2162613.1 unnamed protein product [Oppiella nova]